MNKETWIIILVFFCIILIVLGILQIIWIRAKLNTYNTEKLASELRLKDNIAQACPTSNLSVYALTLNTKLTSLLNKTSSSEYGVYNPLVKEKTVLLPYMCSNEKLVTYLQTTLSGPRSLVFNTTENLNTLTNFIQSNALIMLMINNIVYIAGTNDLATNILVNTNKNFEYKTIIDIYPVISPTNMIADLTKYGCTITMVPFMGSLSKVFPEQMNEMYKQLGIDGTLDYNVMNIMSFGILGSN